MSTRAWMIQVVGEKLNILQDIARQKGWVVTVTSSCLFVHIPGIGVDEDLYEEGGWNYEIIKSKGDKFREEIRTAIGVYNVTNEVECRVAVGALCEQLQDGTIHIFITAAVHTGASLIVSNRPIERHEYAANFSMELVGLLAKEFTLPRTDYNHLYRILQHIHRDFGQCQEKSKHKSALPGDEKLYNLMGTTKQAFQQFSKIANSYELSGTLSRHGAKPDKAPEYEDSTIKANFEKHSKYVKHIAKRVIEGLIGNTTK